ncbi:MAG: hypothetical protein JNM51_14165, partial [Bacteroidia bacterium]|nr:hypothetical protein [Bacteroidia bacterium]
MKLYIKYPTLIVFFILSLKANAQKEFAINSPGSICDFHFLCYAPNSNYINTKRPYIFVIGKPGEATQDTYAQDSLKDIAQFYNYMFVYIPNLGKDATQKLNCIESLASLLTYNYTYGNNNLFFQIRDKEITETDINTFALNKVFKSVRLNNIIITDSVSSGTPSQNVTQAFVESIAAYDEASEDEEDKFGTFYQEETNESANAPEDIKSQKVYFGPPEAFKYTLTGLIRDRSTGEALPFANIMVKG